MPGTRQIPLTGKRAKQFGAVAIVDEEDYERIVAMGRWYLSDMGYAVRRTVFGGQKVTIRMHRVINQTPKGLVTDHINRNRLDNRRANLRAVTQAVNSTNREQGLGVWYQRQNQNWVVEIRHVHIGVFLEFELAYQIAQMIFDGELPLGRIKTYDPFCVRGHNKEVVGTYGRGCRKCALENQKNYHTRRNSRCLVR